VAKRVEKRGKGKDKGKIPWQSNVQIPSGWQQIQGVTVMGLAAVKEAAIETKPEAYDATDDDGRLCLELDNKDEKAGARLTLKLCLTFERFFRLNG